MQDQNFMQRAIELARLAAAQGEVPVGAVLVKDGLIVGEGWNRPISSCDPTAHAEVLALRVAGLTLGNYRLPDCDLYVSLEPCVMCAGAIMHARVRRVIFGAKDPKTGACGSVVDTFANTQLNHHTEVFGGLYEAECGEILRDFFRQRRLAKKLFDGAY